MVDPVLVAKAAATLLTNEKARKGVGWAIAAILSPIIVVVALLCVLGSGAVSHNISAAQLCFQGGEIPADVPAEYRVCIEQTRASFAELDSVIADIQSNMDKGNSLDPIRVKAVFFSLYFGGEAPPLAQFAHCFASSETRTETVTEKDEDGNDIEVERIYNVFVPIEDMAKVYSNLAASLGADITEEQKTNADSVYSLPRQVLEGYMRVRDILQLDGVSESASLTHKDSTVLVPLEDLEKLTASGQEDFAALLDARVADIRVDDGEPELVLEGVEAKELERFCDALEAHEQAEQAMGDMTP